MVVLQAHVALGLFSLSKRNDLQAGQKTALKVKGDGVMDSDTAQEFLALRWAHLWLSLNQQSLIQLL